MKFHTVNYSLQRWHAETQGWSAIECGAYFNLMVAHYQSGMDGIPNDAKRLAAMARVNIKSWGKIAGVILDKFETIITPSGKPFLTHSEVVADLKRAASKSKQTRDSALKKHENARASAATEQSNKEYNTQNKEYNSSKDILFETFWDAYPKKSDKASARLLFDKISADIAPEKLLAAAKNYADHMSGDQRRYAVSPVKWFENETYKDFLPSSEEQSLQLPEWLNRVEFNHLSEVARRQWLCRFEFSEEDTHIILTASDKLSYDWVQQNYLEGLERSFGKPIKLVLAT